jgi:hypothetical protein
VEARPLLAWEPEIAEERRGIEMLTEKVSGSSQTDPRVSLEDQLDWLHKISLDVEAFVAALPKGELDGRIEEGMAALRELLDPASWTSGVRTQQR